MRVVVVGSGIAGVTFAEKFRALTGGEIFLVTRETDGYYSRPLLSRGFSMSNIEHGIILKSFDKLAESGITLRSGTRVAAIDRAGHRLRIESAGKEDVLAYDKLVLATGSAAFIPPPLRPFEPLFYCLNSLADLKTLRRFRDRVLSRRQPRWGIIGGGLIGCEIASDLAAAGDQVILFHIGDRLMERQLVADDSALLQEVLTASGVRVLLNQKITGIVKNGEELAVLGSSSLEVDGVVVCCGFLPRTGLAAEAGLAVERGIKVDGRLSTSDPAISALGDVAQLPGGKLYAYILPIRNQALWLANFLAGREPERDAREGWIPPAFTTKAKVHGFEARHPYILP